jgi:hypothetical protein
MPWVLAWVAFCILVGVLAQQRGRLGVGWGFLAFAVSPLLAGVILFVLPNARLEEERTRALLIAKRQADRAAAPVSSDPLVAAEEARFRAGALKDKNGNRL